MPEGSEKLRTVPASAVFTEAPLGPLKLRNRLMRTAAFEGMAQGGVVSGALIAHHKTMAAGGVGLTTVAYAAVSPDGRTYGHQLLLTPDGGPGLRRLSDAIHREGAAAALQIGHSGDFAAKALCEGRPIGPIRRFNLYGLARSRAMTRADMDRVVADFAAGATIARAAGFDAVELHAGHGYLLSQFLSPYTNRRSDDYGGTLENRLRFPLAVFRAVRAALGTRVALLVKLNLTDGFARGLGPAEAVEVARRFEREGADALVLSGGFVSKTPFYMLRGDLPVRDMVRVQPSRVRKVGLTLFGRFLVPHHPFAPLFFLDDALAVRAAVRLPLVLVGGIREPAHLTKARLAGFDFLALGRPLIREPDLPRRWAAGRPDISTCIPCNRCIAEMDRGGVRCVLDPPGGA